MADYIYTNKAGIELRREPKGRGKPRSGSVKKDDGNFYIVDDGSIPPTPKKAEVPAKAETPPTETVEVEEVVGNIKVRKESKKIPLEQFIKSFHYSPQDMHRTDDKITMVKCIQQHNLEMDSVKFNSPYAAVEVCLKTGVISVWITYYVSKPSFVVNNALILN